jgi:hypothetical protein
MGSNKNRNQMCSIDPDTFNQRRKMSLSLLHFKTQWNNEITSLRQCNKLRAKLAKNLIPLTFNEMSNYIQSKQVV